MKLRGRKILYTLTLMHCNRLHNLFAFSGFETRSHVLLPFPAVSVGECSAAQTFRSSPARDVNCFFERSHILGCADALASVSVSIQHRMVCLLGD